MTTSRERAEILLRELRGLGVTFALNDEGRPTVRFSADCPSTPMLLEYLRENREAVVEILREEQGLAPEPMVEPCNTVALEPVQETEQPRAMLVCGTSLGSPRSLSVVLGPGARPVGAMSRPTGGLAALLMLGASVVFVLYALAQPVPEDRARAMDSLGRSTGIVWPGPVVVVNTLPAGHELAAAPPTPAPAIRRPSTEALLAGRACLPLAFLLSNRPTPTDFGYERSVACERKGPAR